MASAPSSPAPSSPTAAPERTALAWQRTATALAAGGVALARWTSGPLAWLTATLGVLAFACAAAAMVASVRRGRVPAGDPTTPGWVPLMVLAAVWMLGCGALAHVLLA